MEITLDQIKKLRQMTGVSMQACKNALKDTEGDVDKAVEYLRKKGATKAAEKASRETKEGIIECYIHGNRKVGAMIELHCETDFVARNEDFISLARDIAMHIVAMNPQTISPDEVKKELIDKEREIWTEQLKNDGKPEEVITKILEGKENKFKNEAALLSQNFVKNPELTIEKLISDTVLKLGENIKISKFERFEI